MNDVQSLPKKERQAVGVRGERGEGCTKAGGGGELSCL